MRYAFIDEHRPLFSIHAMCRCLCIHPSGFYAWLKNPLSKRGVEDQRQIKLIKEAWKESGEVYGYRKLHDDLCDQGPFIRVTGVRWFTNLDTSMRHEPITLTCRYTPDEYIIINVDRLRGPVELISERILEMKESTN